MRPECFIAACHFRSRFEAKNNDQDEDAGCFKAFTVAVATDSFTEKLSKPLRSEEQ